MGGHRNLLKPKSDLATLLSTLQGLPILVGEKNPLTSGPLALHALTGSRHTDLTVQPHQSGSYPRAFAPAAPLLTALLPDTPWLTHNTFAQISPS